MDIKFVFPPGHRFDLVEFGEILMRLAKLANRCDEAVEIHDWSFPSDNTVRFTLILGSKTATIPQVVSSFVIAMENMGGSSTVLEKEVSLTFVIPTRNSYVVDNLGMIMSELKKQLLGKGRRLAIEYLEGEHGNYASMTFTFCEVDDSVQKWFVPYMIDRGATLWIEGD